MVAQDFGKHQLKACIQKPRDFRVWPPVWLLFLSFVLSHLPICARAEDGYLHDRLLVQSSASYKYYLCR